MYHAPPLLCSALAPEEPGSSTWSLRRRVVLGLLFRWMSFQESRHCKVGWHGVGVYPRPQPAHGGVKARSAHSQLLGISNSCCFIRS